jgi:hypothetical protein
LEDVATRGCASERCPNFPSAARSSFIFAGIKNAQRSCGHGASSRHKISTAVEKQKTRTLLRSNESSCQAIEILPES